MVGDSQFTVKSMSPHPMKIDVIKFDGKNNFGIWRCEVIDALTTSNLKDSLCLGEKSEETFKKDWDKMNRMTYGLTRSCLTRDIKYHVLYETFTRKMWEILKKKYQTKNIEARLHLKRRLYRFQLKRGLSIDEHITNYTKLLTDLVMTIRKKDKVVILLNSLPDEQYI